eukprot:GHRR01022177.1.p1 GENE.GHRR01022177.1~~GHRR01022177.1.p1  ORF type:complete len:249 (+),score=82.46 GHRR01022177.1:163-909(+)
MRALSCSARTAGDSFHTTSSKGSYTPRFAPARSVRALPVQVVTSGHSALAQPLVRNIAPATANATVLQGLSALQAQGIVEEITGPLLYVTAHYRVNFGDTLKVIGSSNELGAWDVATAPGMTWGEGDVWWLVVPVAEGDHEFKVIVQKANGEVVWEDGDNRKLSVAADAPAGSMLVADCCFSFAALMPEPLLQPVTEHVVLLLQAKAEQAKAVEAEVADKQANTQRLSEAALAVAKALATLGEFSRLP